MIQMVSGSTLYDGKLYTASDEPFQASAEVEHRLVKMGVAVAVNGTESQTKSDDAEVYPESEVEAHFYDASMTFKQLQDVAARMGVDVSGARSKAAIIDALDAAAEPPELEAVMP